MGLNLGEIKHASDLLNVSGRERLVARTLLPVAAGLYREGGAAGNILATSREWMLDRISLTFTEP
jgi:hypothetical protein